jgi:hypothetical protein
MMRSLHVKPSGDTNQANSIRFCRHPLIERLRITYREIQGMGANVGKGSLMSSVSGAVGSLRDTLSSVTDHRRPEGTRYPLTFLQLMAVAAFPCGRWDQLGMVQ